MRLSLGAILLAALALATAACGSSHSTVSSSRLILGGNVQCTATVTTPVDAGRDLGISFAFHNVSKRTVKVYVGTYGGTWAVVRSPDGTTYDTRVPLEDVSVPNIPPTRIAPGKTVTTHPDLLRIRWEGPLRITPGCDLSPLHAVRVPVASPGLPASESAALNTVVAATGHLLDHCRPSIPGVSVVGRIAPPKVLAPPLPARCTVTLRREHGFYVADMLIVSPSNLPGIHVEQPYGALSGPNGGNGNTEAILWEFVVTRDGATLVDAGEGDTTVSAKHMAPAWTWTGSTWKLTDSSRCGGSDGGNSATVVLISVCRR